MKAAPQQYTNRAARPEYAAVVENFQSRLAARLRAVRDNDLERSAAR